MRRVRDGVITGEGPTTKGRIHFSRTLDAQDAALCERILIAAGGEGDAVTRAEAEVLIEIDAAAAERVDHGRFDDLFVKAMAHHVLASAGRPVPPREVALAPQTPLSDWAPHKRGDIDAEVLEWIASHARSAQAQRIIDVARRISGRRRRGLDGADARCRRRHAHLNRDND